MIGVRSIAELREVKSVHGLGRRGQLQIFRTTNVEQTNGIAMHASRHPVLPIG